MTNPLDINNIRSIESENSESKKSLASSQPSVKLKRRKIMGLAVKDGVELKNILAISMIALTGVMLGTFLNT